MISPFDEPVLGVSSTRVYCRHDCPAWKRRKPLHLVRFENADEACRLGFRPCRICHPPATSPGPILCETATIPLGPAILARSSRGVCALGFVDGEADRQRLIARIACWFPGAPLRFVEAPPDGELAAISSALSQNAEPTSLPLDLHGTRFQLQVWEALRSIPRGATRTYREIARQVGRPTASRAVGAACGANPVALLVPCHRVLATSGSLGGFRWGINRKQALLLAEGFEAGAASRRRNPMIGKTF